MSSDKPSTTTPDSTTVVPISTGFCADDADVIIRAAGTLDFHAHKLILSLVSPFFKDMFSLPQPPSDTPETLPHVDVQESPKTWENILRTIYPAIPNPAIDTLDDLQSLLFAARVYEMEFVIETHKNAFENWAFIEGDPLHLFSIACACGFEAQATYVARNAGLLGVTRRFDYNNLKGLTFDVYGRLVSFLAERDNEWHQILRNAEPPYRYHCIDCYQDPSRKTFYDRIKVDLDRPSLQTEGVYTRALEYRSECSPRCPPNSESFGHSAIKKFIEEMVEMREGVNDKFQPAKWYYKCTTKFRPNSLIDIILLGLHEESEGGTGVGFVQ